MLRLIAVLALLGGACYLLLRSHLRWRERQRLEREWDAAHPGGTDAARRAFVQRGMAAFHGSPRERLATVAALLPLAAVAAIMYAVNND